MVLSAILEKEPEPVRSLRPAATPELERLIASCLEKDPERRWQSAHDLAVQLHALPTRSGMTAGRRGASRREAAAWSLAILALLALPGGWLYLRPGESVPRRALYRTSVLPPPGVTFSPHHFAVSPDGTRLAFAAFDENGRTALWIRSLVSGGVQQVPETDDAQYPLQLRVADLATGAIRPVVEAPSGRGAAWNRGGDIVYAPTVDGPMFRVSEHGRPPQQATRLDPQSSGAHRWPWFLPDGRRFLYVDEWGARERPPGLYAASLDGGEDSLVSSHIYGSVAYGAGHVLYVQDGNLMAQPFDAERLTPAGSVIPILHGVLRADSAFRNGNFSISADGVLVVQSVSESPAVKIVHADEAPTRCLRSAA